MKFSIPLVLVLITLLHIQCLQATELAQGEQIPLVVIKLWPTRSPSETYSYHNFPFCPTEEWETQDLGETLIGSRKLITAYKLPFRSPQENVEACSLHQTEPQMKQLKDMVARDFQILFYYDDIPLKTSVGFVEASHDNKRYFLSTHYSFVVGYNGNKVIEIKVTPDQSKALDITEVKARDVKFTYSVLWAETSRTYESRMDKFDSRNSYYEEDIQWFSIINSLVLVVFLTFFLAFIMLRILKKDYQRYTTVDEEEDQEETGWKLLHGDVFRFPKNINLLSAILGNGAQILSLFVSVLFLAVVGFFYPYYSRGAMYTAIIVIYALTTGIAGYVSGSFYKQLGGTKWVHNVVLTLLLFVGPAFAVWSVLNTIAIIYASSAAFPFGTIAGIVTLYLLVSFPLMLIGAITAKNFAQAFDAPCRTKQVPREIPPTAWYKSLTAQFLIAGFLPFSAIYVELYYIFVSLWGQLLYTPYTILALVFGILVMVTACITIAMTYLQLSQEDHKWWWRSVVSGGATSVFIYAYCFFFLFYESQMEGTLQLAFYFGYMLLLCYSIALMLSTVGFLSSLWFVRLIFRVIKCD